MNFLFALILLITYYYTEGTDSSGDKNYRKDKSQLNIRMIEIKEESSHKKR
jgi:hypothetical protein